jgi:hypothetical protein
LFEPSRIVNLLLECSLLPQDAFVEANVTVRPRFLVKSSLFFFFGHAILSGRLQSDDVIIISLGGNDIVRAFVFLFYFDLTSLRPALPPPHIPSSPPMLPAHLLTQPACPPPVVQDNLRHGLACKVQLAFQHRICQPTSAILVTLSPSPRHSNVSSGECLGNGPPPTSLSRSHTEHTSGKHNMPEIIVASNYVSLCDPLPQSVCSAARPKAILVSSPTRFTRRQLRATPSGYFDIDSSCRFA